jgi:cellobiose-specific phosphotransferase system component IIB
MADDTLNRIEKHMEGNTLALSAVAEVLQKMDDRFIREEDVAFAKQEQEQAVDERSAMVKAIASEVYGMMKADNGMDVDGTKVRSGTKMKGRGEDVESAVNPTTKLADQQATIQAAEEDDEEEDVEKEGDEKAEDDKKFNFDKEHDGAAEHPKDEEEAKKMYKGDDEEEDKDLEEMAKELDALKKQIANTESNMQKAVQEESEQRLRKMGFREELGLQAPQQISPLGVDGTTPIVKGNGNSVDTVDQLAGMSYKELRNLQTQIEMGNTDGVPRELLSN